MYLQRKEFLGERQNQMNQPNVQHLIVLMMENRSFDHLLGYLKYPKKKQFEGIRDREGEFVNRTQDGREVYPSPNANFSIFPGPDHSHEGVMEQLLGSNPRVYPYQVTNQGFAMNYEKSSPGQGSKALECFRPDQVPVLSKLAMEFAVCDHWFCSVPGETWPNRNFAHAGTSDGEVNIRNVRKERRFFENRTIFEELSYANRDWAVYYSGFPPQTLVFPNLWSPVKLGWLQRFKPIEKLYRAIRFDRLPHYSFVEPDMIGRISDSQHPGMGGEMDFKAGERLIWRIYNTLRENRRVFNKTLFLITYDEHGGFFDHVSPPQGSEWSVKEIFREADYEFKFDFLGPRVPAVLVSPWIARGTVDHTIYDHASIPATVLKIFNIKPSIDNALGDRVAQANTFDRVLNLEAPRERLPQIDEPVVDEQARQFAEGEIELRESMLSILRDLIWEEIRRQSIGQFTRLREKLGYGGRRGVNDEQMIVEMDRHIREAILPQLSPQARQALIESGPPPVEISTDGGQRRGDPRSFGFGIDQIVALMRSYVEKLIEDIAFVDDAALYVERILRDFFQESKVILRTANGLSFEQPDRTTMEREINLFFERNVPTTTCWLVDQEDRWLTLYPDQQIDFYDPVSGTFYELNDVTPESIPGLLNLLREGKIEALQAKMKFVGSLQDLIVKRNKEESVIGVA
jgi:phospholipase C